MEAVLSADQKAELPDLPGVLPGGAEGGEGVLRDVGPLQVLGVELAEGGHRELGREGQPH